MISKFSLIVLLFCTSSVFGQLCTQKITQTQIIGSFGEQMRYCLRENFFSGINLSFSFKVPTPLFQIVQPIDQQDTPQIQKKQMTSIKQIAPFTDTDNGAWLNSYAALDVGTDNASIVAAYGTSLTVGKSPAFSDIMPLYTGAAGSTCYGVLWVDDSTFLADCVETVDAAFSNAWFVSTKQTAKPVVKSHSGYLYAKDATTSRILGQRFIFNSAVGKWTKYIFRGTPHFGLPDNQRGNSLIEVFVLDENNTPQDTGFTLDGATLAVASGETDAAFTLVDFKVLSNGDIFILDESKGVYKFTLTTDGQWTFQGKIAGNAKAAAYALSVNNLLSPVTGFYDVQVGVLYASNFVVYTWSDSTTPPSATMTHTLPFSVKSATQISTFSISQSFIVVKDQTSTSTYLFASDLTDVYYTKTGTQLDTVIVNPFLPTAVSVNLKNSQTHVISNGQLYQTTQIAKTTTTDPYILIATSTVNAKTETCQVNLFYTVEEDVSKIIQYVNNQNSVLPQQVIYPSNLELKITKLASGPALTYTQPVAFNFLGLDATTQTIKAYQAWEMAVTRDQTYPAPDQINFVYILSLDYQKDYIQFVQDKASHLQLWECAADEGTLATKATCTPFATLPAPATPLTIQKFQAWPFFDQTSVVIQTSDYKIEMWTCDSDSAEQACQSLKEISYEAKAGNEIVGFTTLKNFMYVNRKNSIDVYYMYDNTPLVYTITLKSLTAQGFTGTSFTPRAIYGNKKFNPSLLYIDNQDSLLIIDYHTGLNLISVIPYGLVEPQVQVGVGQKSFFLILNTATEAKIHEYNYEDLTNVFLERDVPLYGFTVPQPLQGDFSSQSGFFFLRAQDKTSGNNVVLVLRPNTVSRDTLYTVIDTGSKSTNVLVGANGDSNMYVYVNVGDKESSWQVLQDPLLTVVLDGYTDQSTPVSLKLNINNNLGAAAVELVQEANVFSTMNTITIKQDQFDNLAADFFKVTNSKDQFVPLANDWFVGQVLLYDIQCTDCGKNIKMANRVELANSIVGIKGVTDFAGVPKSTDQYAQAPDSIYVLDSTGNLARPIISLDFETATMTCDLVTSQSAGEYIISLCQDQGQHYAYVTSCIAQNECFPVGAFQLPELQSPTKAALLGNTLLVQDNNKDQSTLSQGKAYAYNIHADVEINGQGEEEEITVEWDFELQTTFDDMFFQVHSPVYLSDFNLQGVQMDDKLTHYQIYFLDAKNSLVLVDATLQPDGYCKFNPNTEYVDLRQFLSSKNVAQYVSDKTVFYQVNPIGDAVYDATKKTVQTQVLFTTSNVNHFVLGLTFDTTDPAASHLVGTTLQTIINRYGEWPAMNKVRVSGELVVIPYYDTVTSSLILASYNITSPPTPTNDGTPVVLMSGGYAQKLQQDQASQIGFSTNKNGNTNQLYVTNPTTGIDQFNLNPVIGLRVTNGNEVLSQQVTMTASNGYTNAVGTVKLTHVDESSEDKKFAWYWILLICLGGVIVLGGIFFLCKKKNSSVDDQGLLDTKS